MSKENPIADSLESEIVNNPEHYRKLKDVATNGKAVMNQILRQGADESLVKKYKLVLEMYELMDKFIDSIHIKK